MTNRDRHPGRRAALTSLLAALFAVSSGCAGGTTPDSAHPNQPRAEENEMTQRVLIAMTSHDKKGATGESTGAYLPEIAHPYAEFTKAGIAIDFASARGGRVPLDGVDEADPASAPFLDGGALAGRLHDSLPADSVEPSRYAAIFFAGGHGTMWDFPENEAFARVATRIYERGGVVGAVCHGPAALVNVRLSSGQYLVAGKAVSAFTNEEERAVKLDAVVPFLLQDRLVERGALFQPAAPWQKQVVVAERLVTGQNPASAQGVAEAMVRLLHREGR
ncbi:type 1 glutamine amidotransferase domain-containing protein [Sorangium sp. So ce260]|uniref:type 1 glutamine amidotransferase domain-containing protein n=1 Tax=Sorangium sp. So ce260 TaxID=3133291 RepID=UPI003F6314C8